MPPRFGAHMSIAGGIERAVDRAVAVGCSALQVFTRSATQWAARPLREDECLAFREKAACAGLQPVLAHDSYLINVASPEPALRARSVDALTDEVDRCDALAIPYLVMHPGAHLGAGEAVGLSRVAAALDEVHARRPGSGVRILLENTAGQGSTLGHRFEHLAFVLDSVRQPERLGVCFDTAHAFAAGYELSTEAGWESTWRVFDATIGLQRLCALHVNDSKKPLGSRVDRHEQVGLGLLGPEPFWRLCHDPRFAGLPASLETEKDDDLVADVQNLAVLARLGGCAAPPSVREVRAWRAQAAQRSAVRPAKRVPRGVAAPPAAGRTSGSTAMPARGAARPSTATAAKERARGGAKKIAKKAPTGRTSR